MKNISLDQLEQPLSYEAFVEEMQDIVDHGSSHKIGYTENLIGFTQLNLVRKQRWNKKLDLAKWEDQWKAIEGKFTLLVISEGWCGDAAHIVPVMAKLSSYGASVNMLLIHRDQNLEIMDAFLTNGGRAIPKAVLLDANGEVLGSWGPRPQILQASFLEERAKGEMTGDEIKIYLQKWYNRDKGQTTASELTHWMKDIIKT